MLSVFETDDYKSFLKRWIEARPKGGRGEGRRIAERLAISSTMVSQIINGDKHFTTEAASDLVEHLALSEREGEHFLLLVDYARAGSHGLRERIRRRLLKSREEARTLTQRIEQDSKLSDAQAAVYYSHWIYTGLTNWIATDGTASIEEMAKRMNLPVSLVSRVISFLLEAGIVVQADARFDIGLRRTVLGADSPLVVKHHQNWRLQGFNKMSFADKQNLFLTMPMSLSKEVAERIRDDLPAYIQRVAEWVGPSESEVVRCLNLDYFEY